MMKKIFRFRITRLFDGYGDGKPLAGYAILLALFSGLATGFAMTFRERDLPERIAAGDLALLGIATHKLSRLVAKDKVTAPWRAPFTRYVESEGGGEVLEKTRGTGLRAAIGELANCPYCVGPWVAAGLVTCFVLRPRLTRLLSCLLASVAASHFLHHAYAMLKGAQRSMENQ